MLAFVKPIRLEVENQPNDFDKRRVRVRWAGMAQVGVQCTACDPP